MASSLQATHLGDQTAKCHLLGRTLIPPPNKTAMRKRNNPVQIYLDDAELKRLDEWSAAANMSRSNYIRQLIAGFQPVEFPPAEYKQVIDELQHIGINMNQLATKAHSLGFIDEPEYRRNANRVWRIVAELSAQLARGGIKIGGNKNMVCKKPPKGTD